MENNFIRLKSFLSHKLLFLQLILIFQIICKYRDVEDDFNDWTIWKFFFVIIPISFDDFDSTSIIRTSLIFEVKVISSILSCLANYWGFREIIHRIPRLFAICNFQLKNYWRSKNITHSIFLLLIRRDCL